MKSTLSTAASARNTNAGHPPLARNAQGHPIALPDGTDSFAIKRETRGRPQVIKGPDGHPYRLPLHATKQDIRDTFGSGSFRIEALDALGNALDYVTTVEITGDEIDDDVIDDDRGSSIATRPRGQVSDLRYALETVTEMARAQADSIRALAEAQADWVKGLASAKALPRNAGYAMLPAPAPDPDAGDADEDDDDRSDEEPADAPPPAPPWVAVAQAVAAQAADTLTRNAAPAVEAWIAKVFRRNGGGSSEAAPSAPSTPTTAETPAGPPPRDPMVHLAEIHAGLLDDEQIALNRALRAPGAEVLTAELLARTVDEAITFVQSMIAAANAQDEHAHADAAAPRRERREATRERSSAPADVAAGLTLEFLSQIVAVGARLDPDQRAAVLALVPRLAPERVEELKVLLLPMQPDDAAAWVRDNLERLCQEVDQ